MYYALFDFEYEKDVEYKSNRNDKQLYFMKHPLLYKLGINSECYGPVQFIAWLLYALWHALLVYMTCFWCAVIPGQSQPDGKDIGFWVVGHVVYGAYVLVANIVIAHKFNNYTGWGEVTCAIMIMAFFTIFFLENLLPQFSLVYLIFDTAYMTPIIWAAMIFIALQTSAFEFFVGRLHNLGFLGQGTDEVSQEAIKHNNVAEEDVRLI